MEILSIHDVIAFDGVYIVVYWSMSSLRLELLSCFALIHAMWILMRQLYPLRSQIIWRWLPLQFSSLIDGESCCYDSRAPFLHCCGSSGIKGARWNFLFLITHRSRSPPLLSHLRSLFFLSVGGSLVLIECQPSETQSDFRTHLRSLSELDRPQSYRSSNCHHTCLCCPLVSLLRLSRGSDRRTRNCEGIIRPRSIVQFVRVQLEKINK